MNWSELPLRLPGGMATVSYSSTTLNAASKRCPRAVDFLLFGEAYDRRMFEAGIAAHACLQSLGEFVKTGGELTEDAMRETFAGVTATLIGEGRVFAGHPEPPLTPDGTFSGRDLAFQFARRYPERFTRSAHYEIGLAVNAAGEPCRYGDRDKVALSGILDVVGPVSFEDEETSARGLLVTDYKSAWSADESELDTIQRKCQAVLAWKTFAAKGDFDFIRLEVVNLRTQKSHPKDIFVAEGLEELIELWWQDIRATMRALDEMVKEGQRKAIPSGGCFGCPWSMVCEPGRKFMLDTGLPADPYLRAELLALAKQHVAVLSEALKEDTAEGPIVLDSGESVGTCPQVSKQANGNTSELWEEWHFTRKGDGPGFVKAVGLTSGNIESLAKVMHSDAEARRAFVAKFTEPTIRRSFGIHPKPALTQEVSPNGAAPSEA